MKYSTATAVLAALSPLVFPGVAADRKRECSCESLTNGRWGYDWQLTFNACSNSYSGEANYNHGLGRCKWFGGKRVDSKNWNADCEVAARNGYYPITDNAIDTTEPKITGRSGRGSCKR
ncbi:hypothetical protein F66182_953 [Fusarium sp. NRRL 66182]|nr:hypothetical protein F66182_953 [Fusarium sp. NRRL 66182]